MLKQTGLIRDGVYDRIRDEILSCDLEPGVRIHENVLAQRYEVSKSPVRDALLRLQEQGLIEVIPRKGYRVRPVSAADARDLYEMRQLLERAALERTIETATDEELESLDYYRTVDDAEELVDWVLYNRQFHRAVAALCGNARLTKQAQDVIDLFDRLTFMSVATTGAVEVAEDNFLDEHCEIIDAIQARDKRLAVRLMNKHINSSRKRLLSALDNPPIVP
ncbi:MAG: GntR family transcriptional regulator [Rhodospirillales bacterium]|nr:GntR family transcriptional regulator [Rhodospirillales bacterium]